MNIMGYYFRPFSAAILSAVNKSGQVKSIPKPVDAIGRDKSKVRKIPTFADLDPVEVGKVMVNQKKLLNQ